MNYETLGMAGTLAGLERAMELIKAELDQIRAQLDHAQQGGNARSYVEERKKGRPPGSKAKTGSNGWPPTPEARKKEMARRMAVARGEVPSVKMANRVDVDKLHPRDPRSPRNKAWKKKMRKVMKDRWAQQHQVAARQINGAAA